MSADTLLESADRLAALENVAAAARKWLALWKRETVEFLTRDEDFPTVEEALVTTIDDLDKIEGAASAGESQRKHNDCLRCAVATVLALPYSDVPHFAERAGKECLEDLVMWAAARGIEAERHDEDPGVRCVAFGNAARGRKHAVVWHRGLQWDPHESRVGLAGEPDYFVTFGAASAGTGGDANAQRRQSDVADRTQAAPPLTRVVGGGLWRVGRRNPLNVYEGDRSVCQCHDAADARRIVDAVNRCGRPEPSPPNDPDDSAEAIAQQCWRGEPGDRGAYVVGLDERDLAARISRLVSRAERRGRVEELRWVESLRAVHMAEEVTERIEKRLSEIEGKVDR